MGTPTALSGLLVADFSRVLAAPLATMTLGDLGAEVVKVEHPSQGDDTRQWKPPEAGGESTYFLAVNRNKTSVALDLSTPDGAAHAYQLAVKADVLVENFAPGTMARFGLGYERLARANPRLVYASLTGFGGATEAPGYDFLVQAVGGLMSMTGTPEGEPTKVGVALVDVLAGQNLVAGILAALYHRERTGLGQRVEVNLLASLLAAMVNQASAYLNAAVLPARMGNAHPSVAPYQTLRTADEMIAVAVGTDSQYRRMAEVLDGEVPGAATPDGTQRLGDERFATNALRVEHRDELVLELERRLTARPAQYWVDALGAAGVACGLVGTIADGFALAASVGQSPVVTLTRDDGTAVRSVACPIGLSRTPATYRCAPPILAGLGSAVE